MFQILCHAYPQLEPSKHPSSDPGWGVGFLEHVGHCCIGRRAPCGTGWRGLHRALVTGTPVQDTLMSVHPRGAWLPHGHEPSSSGDSSPPHQVLGTQGPWLPGPPPLQQKGGQVCHVSVLHSAQEHMPCVLGLLVLGVLGRNGVRGGREQGG